MTYKQSDVRAMNDEQVYALAKELRVKDASGMPTSEMMNAVIAHLVSRGELIAEDGSAPVASAKTSSSVAAVSKPAAQGITVVYPPYENVVQGFAGKTIGDVHRGLREAWSIEKMPRIYLTRGDGPVTQSDMAARLEDGDRVEFMKSSAEKGNS